MGTNHCGRLGGGGGGGEIMFPVYVLEWEQITVEGLGGGGGGEIMFPLFMSFLQCYPSPK